MNYKMTLAYDGSRYDGWQKQGNTDRTIQGKLEAVLSRLAGIPVEVNGAGRTDAGVHASGQTASFQMETELSGREVQDYLNHYLPEDIAVLSLEPAPPKFHARLNALGKRYRYQLAFGSAKPVFDRKYLYRVEEALDFDAISRAAKNMEGTHDFRSFCANRRMKKSSVRTIFRIGFEVNREMGRADLVFEGNGFLYHMVRILTGTLLEVGTGKKKPGDIEKILEARDREAAGFTAPPQGLFLENVWYSEERDEGHKRNYI